MLYSKYCPTPTYEALSPHGWSGVVLDAKGGNLYGAGIFTSKGRIGGWWIDVDNLRGGNTMLHRTNGVTTDFIKIKVTSNQFDEYGDCTNWGYVGGVGWIGSQFTAGADVTEAPGVGMYYGQSITTSPTLYKVNQNQLAFKWNGPFLSINYLSGSSGVIRWQISGGTTSIVHSTTNLDVYDFQRIKLSTNNQTHKIFLTPDDTSNPYTIELAASAYKFKVTKSAFEVTSGGRIMLEATDSGSISLSADNDLGLSAVHGNATVNVAGTANVTVSGGGVIAATLTSSTINMSGASTVTTGSTTLSGGAYVNSHSSVKLTCGADNQEGIYARFG